MFQNWVSQTQKTDKALANYLRKDLSIKFKNINLYKLALRHKSVIHRTDLKSNERLEFLGDAILDCVVSDYLYSHFPEATEGKLTKIRSKIVSRDSLSKIARNLSVQNWLEVGKGVSLNAHVLFGNALEALIGALYRDRGYKAVNVFIRKKILDENVDVNLIERHGFDYKSKVLEWVQKNKYDIYFDHIESKQKVVNRFVANAYINNKLQGQGEGNSKKNAEQRACENVFEKIADGLAF